MTMTKKPRGFAAMDPKKVSEIARKGGKASHACGTAHEFTSDEAREAGRKGGFATARARARSNEVFGFEATDDERLQDDVD